MVCAGGGSGGGGLGAPGLGGTRLVSCPEFIIPAPNRVDIDGQIGQTGQNLPLTVFVSTAGGAGQGFGQLIVPGNGGPPVMFGAGAGGTAGQNGSNGYVLISW